MRKVLLSIFVSLLATSVLFAQSRNVSGRVTSDDGLPVPGANILIKGTGTGTVTDADGRYSIAVDGTATLVFSFIGYRTQEILVGERTIIDVQLMADATQLSEVVVTGFAVEQKRDISGSVSSVKGSSIENMPVQSFDRALQGRASGVQVIGNNGLPGGNVTMRIRGTGSILAGNDPLYIVDGVQIRAGDNTGALQSSNALNAINPNDIESIDILKDAAAASIYGAQASNGVVIITTKRGKSGKTKFNINSSWGQMTRLNKLDVLNRDQFVELTLEAYQNSGLGPGNTTYDNLVAAFNARPNSADWQDEVFRKGFMQNYEFSAQGGNDKSSFFLSLSHNDTKSHVIATDFQRTTFRINFDNQVSEKFKISATLSLSQFTQLQPPGGGAFANPVRSAHLTTPLNTVYDENGQYNFDLFGTYRFNLVWLAENNEYKGLTVSSVSNVALDYEILKGLTWKSRFGVDFQDIRESVFWDPRHGDGVNLDGYVFVSDRRVINPQTDHTLNFARTFNGRHAVSAIAGFQYRKETFDIFSADGNGLPSYKVRSLGSAATTNSLPSGNASDFKLFGYFAKVGYILDDKYILSATLRRDGSSRFGANSRYGTFPAVSAAWRVSGEEFFNNVNFISDLKLRLSYGKTGNTSGIGNFASRGTFSATADYNGQGALSPANIANALLTWEENQTTDIGIDFGILESRVSGTIDYYVRDTKGLLLDRPIPNSTGFTSITQNIGKIRNTGIEIELSGRVIDAGDFKWDARANITFQDSKVLALTPETDTLVLANAGGTYIVGQEAQGFYLQEWAGVNPADGRPMWYDKDGNLTYNRTSGNARKFQGSANPDYFGGFTNTFSYKGLSLEAFFQFQVGNLVFNDERSFTDRSGSTADRNQRITQMNRWQTPGQITDVPIAIRNYVYPSGASNPTGQSTRFMERGDYIRLKQVTLSYTIPTLLIERFGITGMRVYGQGVNLWTQTEYSGFDPEFTGGDFGIVPQPKSYVLGLQITF